MFYNSYASCFVPYFKLFLHFIGDGLAFAFIMTIKLPSKPKHYMRSSSMIHQKIKKELRLNSIQINWATSKPYKLLKNGHFLQCYNCLFNQYGRTIILFSWFPNYYLTRTCTDGSISRVWTWHSYDIIYTYKLSRFFLFLRTF